jgi:hypothetical protein
MKPVPKIAVLIDFIFSLQLRLKPLLILVGLTARLEAAPFQNGVHIEAAHSSSGTHVKQHARGNGIRRVSRLLS